MLCPKCGQQNTAGRFCSNCGTQLPLAEGVTPAAAPPEVLTGHYAGFWKRLAAFVLDYAIVGVMAVLAGVVIGLFYRIRAGAPPDDTASSVGTFAVLLIWWLYYALMESSSRQATLGKMALGIKVVDEQGNPVSFARATARNVAKLLSVMILMIGYLMAGFTSRKQALHDMLAGCLVVNRAVAGAGMPAWAIVLVVLAAMVFPVVILTSVALPTYQDYVARARVAIAVQGGNKATQAVETYYARNNRLPRDLREAGMPDLQGREIRQVNVDAGSGTVQIVLAVTPLEGKSIQFVPHRDNNNRVVWTCRSEDVPQRYLPPHCLQKQN